MISGRLDCPTTGKAHWFSRPSCEFEMRCFESEREGDRSALRPAIAKATEPFCLAIAAALNWPALGSPTTRDEITRSL